MAKSIESMKALLLEDASKERLADIYADEALVAKQQERYKEALEEYEKVFGKGEVEIYSAPGRSEVCGNHTDHQLGKVLCTSLNLDFIAVVSKTDNGIIELKSEKYPMTRVDLSKLEINEAEFGTTKALIRGVAATLKKAGHEIGGFKAYITSEVLSGSGMSSSAALEVLIGAILSGLYNDMTLDRVFLAQAGQVAENAYFGKPCGLMDQVACSYGGLVYIDFEEKANPVVKPVNVDFGKYHHSLCIVDTKGSHANLTGDYAAIPSEMKAVAKHFGKEVLRQVDKNEFMKEIAEIRREAGDRAVLRAIHYFEENERVEAQKAALEEGRFDDFKKLIKASGDSSAKYLQNVFATHQVDAQGLSVGLAVSDMVLAGKGVSRVHGGGFAGTIQAFVPDEMVAEYKAAIDHVFGEGSCLVLKVRKYGGIKVFA